MGKEDKDHLVIDETDDRGYRIVWWLADDQDIGGTIGDGDKTYTAADLAKASAGDREHIIACMTARTTAGVEHDNRGFYWETSRAANTALRAINLAINNDGGPPWPEWATKAAAEGWKPPKGWKPQ